ncbi:MAG: hypothetical protein A2168_08550 [Planctomycetes bacterium RBG_13_50_24]|nr:MAG: hypothetical protein A2168_08550 [Planctomycetes bacterium RBG_13_50_24]
MRMAHKYFGWKVCLIILAVVAFLPEMSLAADAGSFVDVVPFGELKKWDSDGKDYGVFWEDARDIFKVVVTFSDTAPAIETGGIALEYWQSTWPNQRIPRETPSGAGSSGWLNVGDWYQGRWRKADVNLDTEGKTCTLTFNPVNAAEFPKLTDFAATYRSTHKLRIVGEAPLAEIDKFEAYTDSVWEDLSFEVEWGGTAQTQQQVWDGRLEIFNGHISQIQPLSPESSLKIAPEHRWTSTVKGGTDGIRAGVLCAGAKGYNSFDETVVTLRCDAATFSFATADLIKWGHIFIPDFGVIVRRAGDKTTYAAARQTWLQNRSMNIYTKVADEKEQTFGRAWEDIPTKEPFYIPLGFDGGRQYFGLEPDGSAFCRNNWLNRIPGRDTKRCLYDGDNIRYRFGLSDAELVERTIVDGSLPMTVTQWRRGGVRYRQTAFVVPFDGMPAEGGSIYADDTLVLMLRFEMTRERADAQADARLDLEVVTGKSENLALDGGFIYVAGSGPERLRMLVTSPDLAATYAMDRQGGKIVYRASLSPEKTNRTLDVAIPYITLTGQQEWTRLSGLRYDKEFEEVRSYWSRRIEQGTQIITPEPMINDYYKATVSHLLLNTDREVGTSDRYVARVGTFSYGAFSNESCMMISDLDRRGYHKRAEQALETWLHYQGTVGLPGDFSTTEGQFYGAAGYEDGGYNQHHGFVLWCLGEHYWYTRDLVWLKRAASKIVAGCDWIINERKRTIAEAQSPGIRAIERGLLPPGNLEDIRDWRSWLSTNVYSWWGMDNAAGALSAAGLPDGERLLREAETYKGDILRAFMDAMFRSPVVRLRDGSWIPHIPPEVHRRGRTFGWITETLEGPIHMIRTGLIEPQDRIAGWIIKDYEDNLYISEQYGYNITGEEFERYWFSRGGISMQANLLCNPIPYLLRDEPKHFLRAYFNAFATSYFPDTRMMTEHALPNIGDHRGDHYKSSDEANSTYWLRMMFVQERGDELWLGAAIPRYWLADGRNCGIEDARTYFGPMSVKYESLLSQGQIVATLDPPRRNSPKKICIRFRHPEAKKIVRCEIDGKPYKNFDPEKEWVVLSECPAKQTRIAAYYE